MQYSSTYEVLNKIIEATEKNPAILKHRTHLILIIRNSRTSLYDTKPKQRYTQDGCFWPTHKHVNVAGRRLQQLKRITVKYTLKLIFSIIHSMTKYRRKRRHLNFQYTAKPLFSVARSTLQDYHNGSASVLVVVPLTKSSQCSITCQWLAFQPN